MVAITRSDGVSHQAAGPSTALEVHQYPASLGQQRFWVLDRLEPGNAALNVAVRWRLEGELSVATVGSAFDALIARHAALRTSFAEVDGEAVQIVQPNVAFQVRSIDLTLRPEAEAECERLARAEARQPFNLAVAPLLRATVVQILPSVAILLLTTHHSVCDGWSIGILAREFGELCEALQSGRPPRLPELPISYADYAERQAALLAAGGLADDVAYWSQALHGLDFFELPTDHRREAARTASSDICSVLLERSLTDDLTAVAHRHGCTMFMAALAALAALLHRYTGATDIAIGTQIAGRFDEDVEDLVGLFINTLVTRNDLTDNPVFCDLMMRTRDVVLGAFEHGLMPLEKVIETLKPKRHPGHNAVFSVNLIFQRSFVLNVDHGRFRLIDLPSFSAGALYDLNFFMVERSGSWRLSCEYNLGLYEAETVGRLLSNYVTLLRSVATDPMRRLADVATMRPAEREALLSSYNQTEVRSADLALALPALFDRQVALTPAAIAVTCGLTSLTYAALQARADAIARSLVARGIGPGARVGIFLKRSTHMLAALLGVLKSGNAYIPLDPIYPAVRLGQIVAQSELRVVIVEPGERAAGFETVACLDINHLVAHTTAATRLPTVGGDDIAYVIFTSGSTGRPKGVQIPHRALTNFILTMQDKPGIKAGDVVVGLTTICFDIAVLELFVPLTVGARVAIATEAQMRDGGALLSLLEGAGATVLQATPTTWRMLLDAGWSGQPKLRMLCGGEAMSKDLASRLLACGAELWNLYGPTETTVWSAVWRVSPADEEVLIGPPIANTQFYVVDRHGALVPPGGIGELLIGGDGVADGYAGLPELTRERFLPDHFTNRPGARLYRTGDLIRMRQPGAWQFLGRSDNQVKIRGYRIELAEIEAALLLHKAVRNAVCVVQPGAGGEPAIVGYVELVSGCTLSRSEIGPVLTSSVAAALPAYMRPASIMVLDKIPRLPNGKIDRKSLPRMETAPSKLATTTRKGSEIESKLSAIWCSVLGLETIDRDADFFEHGGHSLLAARVIARVEATFGRRMSMATLFEAPTVAAFTRVLQSNDHRDFDFRQVARLQPPKQSGNIFAINNTGIYLMLARLLGPEMPVTALQLFDPSYPQQEMLDSIEEIAARYVTLVRQLQPRGPYVLLGWCNGGVLAFEIARQIQQAGETVSQVITIDSWAPGYIKRLGLVRACLADLSYRLQMIAADWSDAFSGRKTLLKFLLDRRIFHRLPRRRLEKNTGSEGEFFAAEHFDRWLVDYLDRLILAYKPQPAPVAMTVFRSAREPSGVFLDNAMGWGDLATASLHVVKTPGNHFSVFQEPGVSAMAENISRLLTPGQSAMAKQHDGWGTSSDFRRTVRNIASQDSNGRG